MYLLQVYHSTPFFRKLKSRFSKCCSKKSLYHPFFSRKKSLLPLFFSEKSIRPQKSSPPVDDPGKGRVKIYRVPGPGHIDGGPRLFRKKKQGGDAFFSKNIRGAEIFFRKELGGGYFFSKKIRGEGAKTFHYKISKFKISFFKKTIFEDQKVSYVRSSDSSVLIGVL